MKYLICLTLIVSALASIPLEEKQIENGFLEQIVIKKNELINQDESQDSTLTFDQMVTIKGYPLSIHYVTTSDGYILKLYRIPGPKNTNLEKLQKDPSKRVVLLQHGLLDSSDSWAAHYEEKAIPFVLANLGYDVWLGNNRGNKHSRQHISINPIDVEFWNFSFHEMGTKDLPAMINHITNETGREKISYIGHSQGTAQLFAALSLDEEYFAKKINTFIALGPITNLHNLGSTFLKTMATTHLDEVFMKYGFFTEFLGNKLSVKLLENFICGNFGLFCEGILKIIADANILDDEMTRFPVFLAHFPSGTSIKTLHHFADSIRNNRFSQLDSNFTPYDLTKLKNVPISLFIGKDDLLATVEDNRKLKNILSSNGSLNFYKEYESMGHMSFFISKTMEHVHDIIDVLDKYNI